MSGTNRHHGGYSANVRMELRVHGAVFVIGQLGPDFIIVDDPADHPPGEGEITLSIDGRVRRWRVRLPDGIAAGKPETRTTDGPAGADGSTAG